MSRRSIDSASDFERFQVRTQHTARDPSPDAQANRRAETDFVAVGAAFWDRRESDPRPNSLDLSEGEEAAQDTLQRNRAEVLSNAMTGFSAPNRSPATPTPTQIHRGPYVQPSDMAQLREIRGRRVQGMRGRYRGPGSQSSIGTVEREYRASDSSNDDDEIGDMYERGRSTTPTPYFPRSYTPSHHSQQTDEDHGEGRGPQSPNPWSSSFRYNVQQKERTEAIEGADTHFPAGQTPRAE